jgi:AGCS family alanine or glycine:cation symporter
MIYGIKRGLYSNEAGVGSAPNASASAMVTHPVKQGLVQTVSVYIDTMLLCTATAFMCLSSGVEISSEVNGTPYVQNALSTVFGSLGPLFITLAMILFAFTTLIGNLYYVENALIYLNGKKKPSSLFTKLFYIVCAGVIFVGAIIPMDAAWAAADITMGLMTIINLPCCFVLYRTVGDALKDYERQSKAGQNPEFRAGKIGLDERKLSFWKD